MHGSPVLQHVALFAGLHAQELDDLAALLRRRQFRKDEVIFREGEPGTALYIIEIGEVKLTLTTEGGREMILTLLGPRAFFGELALLDGDPRSANAVVREDSQLLILQREHFLSFLESRPRVVAPLLAALSRRLRRTTDLVHDAILLDIPARLAGALLRLTESKAERGPDGVVRAPQLTQEELAEMVGATRESINKWLGVYEQQGLLRRHKRGVVVLQPDELRRRLC